MLCCESLDIRGPPVHYAVEMDNVCVVSRKAASNSCAPAGKEHIKAGWYASLHAQSPFAPQVSAYYAESTGV